MSLQQRFKKPPAPVITDGRRLLRLEAAAEYLGVHLWTVRQLVRSREIKRVPIGNSRLWVIDKVELDRYIESQKHVPYSDDEPKRRRKPMSDASFDYFVSDADDGKQPTYRGKLDEHGKPTSALPKEVEFILRLNLPKTKREWLLRKLDHLNREADCRQKLDRGAENPGDFYKPRSLEIIEKCRQEILTELASLTAG